jgi:hypothetical protein
MASPNQINGGQAMVSPVQPIESLYQRLEKAKEIVQQGKVHPIVGMDDHFIVQGNAGYYLINAICTCADAQERTDIHHGWCKHKLAVELFKEMPKEEKPKASKRAKASSNGSPHISTPEEREQHEREVADLFPNQKESAPTS